MADLLKNTQAGLTDSIAKAREAQIKFEQTRAKVLAAKAKADDTIQKAKALQQHIRELKALKTTPGGVQGGIAAIVAAQIGGLRGKLVSQIQGRLIDMLSKFSNQCPSTKELQRIIKIRNTLITHLTGFEKRVDTLSSVGTNLTVTVTALKVLVKVITSIPVPTAVPPGIGLPVNVLTKYSNTLIKLDKAVDKFSAEAVAISSMVSSAKPLVSNLRTRLEAIDILIQQCSSDPSADLSKILTTAQPQDNTNPQVEGGSTLDYTYKGYTLSILQDINTSKIAPRRYAIATDSRGIVVLRGPLSFSSSTQVLLDEIKFRIDNKLA